MQFVQDSGSSVVPKLRMTAADPSHNLQIPLDPYFVQFTFVNNSNFTSRRPRLQSSISPITISPTKPTRPKKRPLKKNEEHGHTQKKKVGRLMGSAWAMCPWNKKKENGRYIKKKLGKRPFFFLLIFGAQLWWIPSPNQFENTYNNFLSFNMICVLPPTTVFKRIKILSLKHLWRVL